MLGADIGKLQNPSLINDEQARTLPERNPLALNIVHLIDFQGIVHQGCERHRMMFEEFLGVHQCIWSDDDNLRVEVFKLSNRLAQLSQMPAAERSGKPTQKKQDKISFSPKIC